MAKSALSMNSETPLLRIRGVVKRFGGLQALEQAHLEVMRGQIVGLIGPNGAGKTTFFNVMTGLYTPDGGVFELAGQTYNPGAVDQVVHAGIARTFQNIRFKIKSRAFTLEHQTINFGRVSIDNQRFRLLV